MLASRDQMTESMLKTYGGSRRWQNASLSQPLIITPGLDVTFYERCSYTLDYARTWSEDWLFVPRYNVDIAAGLEDICHFRVVYGFACGSYVTGVFIPDTVYMDRLSTDGTSVRVRGGANMGWYIPAHHWRNVSPSALGIVEAEAVTA